MWLWSARRTRGENWRERPARSVKLQVFLSQSRRTLACSCIKSSYCCSSQVLRSSPGGGKTEEAVCMFQTQVSLHSSVYARKLLGSGFPLDSDVHQKRWFCTCCFSDDKKRIQVINEVKSADTATFFQVTSRRRRTLGHDLGEDIRSTLYSPLKQPKRSPERVLLRTKQVVLRREPAHCCG